MSFKKTVCILLSMVLMFSMLPGCETKAKKDAIVLIMADVQTGDHPTAKACDEFARLVKEKSGGRIVVEVYHGSTLGTEAQQVDQVTVGGIDFARVSSSAVSKYYDDLKALQALYLYNSEDSMWDVMDGSIGSDMLTSKELEKNGIEGLCWFSGGARNFYNNTKEIKTPKDLSGLTLRVNTNSMFAFLDACGAKGLNVSYNDIYNSITAGKIDGAENNWPSYISTNHYEVAQYITVDEHTRIPEMIIASKSTMDSLSKEDQEIIIEAAKEASKSQRKGMLDYDKEAIEKAEKAGCKITYLSDSQVAEFQKIADPINSDVSAKYISIINKIKSAQK